MSATGKNTQASSTPSFISALVVAGITVGALTVFWLVLHGRRNLNRVYQPRVDLAPKAKRPMPIPSGILPFWRTVFAAPDTEIIVANGVDAYLFVRFLKVFGLYMLVPYFILTFAVCIPLSVVKPNAGQSGLNMLAFGNVGASKQDRHIGHFIVSIILMSYTLFLIWREYNHFIEIRQAWLSSPQHVSLARTRTIAISNIPTDVNSGSGIKELAGTVGRLTGTSASRPSNVTDSVAPEGDFDGVRSVWLTRKIKDLEKTWEERDKECARLEGGVSKLQKLGNQNERKGKTPEKQGTLDTERGGAEMVDRFVVPKKRPTWKQGLLGLIGKNMTLETSPTYIAEHNAQVDEMRGNEDSYPQGDVAFVRFASQAEAHSFARLIPSTDKKYHLVKTHIELVPEDVQWSNTSMSAAQRKTKTMLSWALTIFLIIIWAVPVAFVGLVSNVDTLCTTAKFLAWICKLPKPVLGIIKGVLPPVLLAVLFMLLPIVLRLFIKMQGEVRRSDIELKLFTRFWLFQVIHGFLIVTLASGLISSLGNLGNTSQSVPTLLADNLPGASIFFLTFILTATFTKAAMSYSRVVPFAMHLLGGVLGGNTPRKAFLKTYKMDNLAWATTWPPMCLIICITIVYSVIQPIITLLALVAFVLLYAAYKYLLYWCADQPDSLETGGLYYIKALRTVFVSLYLEGICLAGLFFLSTDQNGKRAKSGLACGALMSAMIIAIGLFQVYIDWFRFKPDFVLYAHSGWSAHGGQSTTKLNGNFGRIQTTASEEEEDAGPELGNTSGLHGRAFDHPALWKQQPVVWIADDPLGIGKFEAARINNAKVEASTDFAHMDAKGTLQVERGPPDEAWYGGYTAQ